MKKNEKNLIRHFISNITGLLVMIVLILMASARKNHTRQMEQISEYIYRKLCRVGGLRDRPGEILSGDPTGDPERGAGRAKGFLY